MDCNEDIGPSSQSSVDLYKSEGLQKVNALVGDGMTQKIDRKDVSKKRRKKKKKGRGRRKKSDMRKWRDYENKDNECRFGNGLFMYCGKRFATGRGMKIHRTKMGCLSMSSQQQRTATADKSLENRSQVQNNSAKEIQAENRDDVLRHPSSDKRQKINFPPASSGKQWEDLDSKIVLKIDSLLGKSTLENKLATFGDIVYQTCLDTFGAKQHQTKCPP
ncbi:polyprotein [Plakobranchus ocellatus]|uniref:Polyprotein n=1 Tax=Plakobranchus ocellatus TaxID=259542 RepID=A0AAV4DJX5_9GAST|nr:polyprotein [Plakobranchus ocellatus]